MHPEIAQFSSDTLCISSNARQTNALKFYAAQAHNLKGCWQTYFMKHLSLIVFSFFSGSLLFQLDLVSCSYFVRPFHSKDIFVLWFCLSFMRYINEYVPYLFFCLRRRVKLHNWIYLTCKNSYFTCAQKWQQTEFWPKHKQKFEKLRRNF